MGYRSVITVGNFDGMHLGHRAILRRARAIADARGLAVVALSFDPHPATVLRPGSEPARLTELGQKRELLRAAGADEVVILTPTREFLGQEPRQFVQELVRQYEPAALVEGPDFRFGHQRRGDVALLRELGGEWEFEVAVVPAVEVALGDQLVAPVSSSLVRWLVAQGRVADAARCLGRLYGLAGVVVAGERRGSSIGVPTANLAWEALAGRVLPAEGVYAGWVRVEQAGEGASGATPGGDSAGNLAPNPQSLWPAAISVGRKPTFGQTGLVIESHVLDYSGDLYGRRIEVRFSRWLRDQQRFPGVEVLRRQLERDVQCVRRWYALGQLGAPVATVTSSVAANSAGNREQA